MGKPTRYRVLCVDDNRDAAEMLALVLDLCGFEARACTDGPTAVDEFHGFGPDACVLDILMPGMDGYELARRLRAAAAGRPLVLLSASGVNGPAELARAAGFDATYAKPVDPQVVVDLLHYLLDRAYADRPATAPGW